jgi:hypothetical protein
MEEEEKIVIFPWQKLTEMLLVESIDRTKEGNYEKRN